MKHLIRNLACAVAIASAMPAAAASTHSPDHSDLWWSAAESGWGAHVTQQDDVIFMVLFVYDGERNPRFLVAPDMRRAEGAADIYEGALHESAGPAFAGRFDPAAVSSRVVGTARLRFESGSSGSLRYTVDGVQVVKAISRQSWRAPDFAGEYVGGLFARAAGCFDGLPTIGYPGTLVISQSGDSITIDSRFSPGFAESGTCRMTGRLVAQGSQAAIAEGTYACEFFEESNQVSGTFEVTGLRVDGAGFSGRYRGRQGAACVHDGHLGGMRSGEVVVPAEPEPQPQ